VDDKFFLSVYIFIRINIKTKFEFKEYSMFKKENFFVFALAGLSIAYIVLSIIVLFTKGKWARAVKQKLTIGALIVTFTAILTAGRPGYPQDATAVPTDLCYCTVAPTPPETPAPSPVPTATPGPTAIPNPTEIPTIEPSADPSLPPDAETPSPPPVATCYVPTTMPTAVPVITAEPGTDCTCDNLCGTIATLTIPFIQDGAGEFCWSTTALGSYINSWNLDVLEVNGVNYTNLYVSTSQIAPLNGKYYIYYRGSVSYGHFEAK
jgi:hypothetical protein